MISFVRDKVYLIMVDFCSNGSFILQAYMYVLLMVLLNQVYKTSECKMAV